ncbi:MAG: hypothetical protein ACRYFU_08590 [Janthinobacterium lividum]
MRNGAIFAGVSIGLGFLLMAPLAMLFDAMGWGLFHTWGLLHGSFSIAWPLLALLVGGSIRCAHWLVSGRPYSVT